MSRYNGSFSEFIDSLPKILAGNGLRVVIEAVGDAYKKGKPVIVMMGTHVIKCGLSPIIIQR